MSRTIFLNLGILLLLMQGVSFGQELTYPKFQLETRVNAMEPTLSPELNQTYEIQTGHKSVGKAFLMSLILPGSGEFYNGNAGHGRFFLGMELLLWGGLFANKQYVNMLKDDYYAYAVQHAGVERSSKDKDFWVNIGKYDDLFTYNEQRRKERNVDALYPEDGSYFWRWDSRGNRFTYDDKRITANEIAGRDTYFYAAIMLNHLVSGINAMRLARKHNRTMTARQTWNLRFFAYRQDNHQHCFGFHFNTPF